MALEDGALSSVRKGLGVNLAQVWDQWFSLANTGNLTILSVSLLYLSISKFHNFKQYYISGMTLWPFNTEILLQMLKCKRWPHSN